MQAKLQLLLPGTPPCSSASSWPRAHSACGGDRCREGMGLPGRPLSSAPCTHPVLTSTARSLPEQPEQAVAATRGAGRLVRLGQLPTADLQGRRELCMSARSTCKCAAPRRRGDFCVLPSSHCGTSRNRSPGLQQLRDKQGPEPPGARTSLEGMLITWSEGVLAHRGTLAGVRWRWGAPSAPATPCTHPHTSMCSSARCCGLLGVGASRSTWGEGGCCCCAPLEQQLFFATAGGRDAYNPAPSAPASAYTCHRR